MREKPDTKTERIIRAFLDHPVYAWLIAIAIGLVGLGQVAGGLGVIRDLLKPSTGAAVSSPTQALNPPVAPPSTAPVSQVQSLSTTATESDPPRRKNGVPRFEEPSQPADSRNPSKTDRGGPNRGGPDLSESTSNTKPAAEVQASQLTAPVSNDRDQDIATQDVEDVRVRLKTLLFVRGIRNNAGVVVNGIRATLELVNRTSDRTLVLGANATEEDRGGGIGKDLRGSVVDENGVEWQGQASSVVGMGVVGVGTRSNVCNSKYNPAEIVSVLQQRDEKQTDVATSTACGYSLTRPFVYGSLTPVRAGQTVRTTVDFPDKGYGTPASVPQRLQLGFEIVIGVSESSAKKSYSLHNIAFDRITLSAR
jgi:hypothetical protein